MSNKPRRADPPHRLSPEDQERWRHTIRHMDRLIHGDYPPFLAAHYLVTVLLPRLAAIVGIEAVTAEIGQLLGRGLALHTGRCVLCRQAEAIRGDDVCAKCLAEQDQVTAEIEEDQ